MSNDMILALIKALLETLLMIMVSGGLAISFGSLLGILLFTTAKNNILSNAYLHRVLTVTVNIVRSVPFIILMVAIIPVTRLLVGTSIGTLAAIVPLTIGAIPFFGRIVENALQEIPHGLIEAGQAMGAKPIQLITHILIPESLPSIVNGITVTLITLIGYSAMAGAVGGGGLGDLAIRYGYERFNIPIMIITVIILIVLVQIIQCLGDFVRKKIVKK